MDDPRIRLDQRDKYRSKFRVIACQLNGQGGEDESEIAPVLEVSGAEERGPEPSVRENSLRDRPCDRALACSSGPAQPVDGGLTGVTRPQFDLVQNCAPGALETTVVVVMSILGLFRLE